MARTRTAPCRYYICEGSCEKGLEGTFNKACQKCKSYIRVYQPPHKKSFNPNDSWRRKKEKNKEKILDDIMREDLEDNEIF